MNSYNLNYCIAIHYFIFLLERMLIEYCRECIILDSLFQIKAKQLK
jgi:hypothetical protein